MLSNRAHFRVDLHWSLGNLGGTKTPGAKVLNGRYASK